MENGKAQVSLEDYEKNLRELVKQLKATNAQLIWCATTPVPDAKLTPPRKDSDVQAYNAVAKKVMDENKIPINDLYAYTLPKLADVQRPANVHFSTEGSQFLAKKVAKSVEEALAKR
jgi:acyl-CoA thioesterase-1